MSRYNYLMIICFLCCSPIFAQEDVLKQDCYFVYIAHDSDTPVGKLSEKIKDMGKDARRYHHPTIFYLSNDESPYVVAYNIEVSNSVSEDDLLSQLAVKLYHPINASFDYEYIRTHFKDLVLGSGSNRTFESINWSFYTTESFWKMGFNESLIASIYWTFSIKNYQDRHLNYNVWYSSTSGFAPNSEQPFGVHNLDGINNNKPMKF